MNIDFCKIEEIYGEETIDLINNNVQDIVQNINYLKELGFTDVEDIFERYVLIFIDDYTFFKKKIDKLIKSIGSDYVEVLEINMDLWEKLL